MSLAESARERPRPIRRSDGRVPPHNLSAEESLLGALLLSRDAVGTVAELGLSVNDFYKPAHQYVYDAIRGLNATGNPVDAVTVADELRRANLLDEIGGAEMLLDLQNATPAISNASRYAKIVQDTAVLRRLIGVAGEIAELAYSEPDDVQKALDEAETKVFEVAEDRVTDSVQPLGDLMPLAMDKLQETFERGNIITGLATGYNDLDELLSGLQPSTLNIVGARPAMGKCVAWDTPMVDPMSGEVRTAQEWYRRGVAGDSVSCLTLTESGRVEATKVAQFYDDGHKPVHTVTTRGGRAVRVTAAHPLLTAQGWKPLAEIMVGDHIAVPATLPVFGSLDLDDAEIKRLARRSESLGGVPPDAFLLDRRGIEQFVAALGVVNDTYVTSCAQLAVDVTHLLLRLGARPQLSERWAHTRGGGTLVFEVVPMDESFDVLPIEVWDDVAKEKGERSWTEINRLGGQTRLRNWHANRKPPLRCTIQRLADELDSDVLRWWASPDIVWDRIVAIGEPVLDQVYDFNVPGTHNFVAGDVFVHNTAFGLGLAVHAAQAARVPVLFFSLEMGHAELTQRILSSEARVDSTKLRNGRLNEADWTKLGRAVGRLEVPLYLDDNPRVTVMEIRAKARRLKAREGLGLIVIDYLQLMSGSNTENRQLEVSEISRGLKILARELSTPIVALSQLSRNLESRSDKRPMLADLRESGSLEQDADVVMFLYRDEVYNGESPDKGSAEIIIAKHRSGPIGMKRLAYLGTYTRFENMARNV
jgi:replicative DNA helicase